MPETRDNPTSNPAPRPKRWGLRALIALVVLLFVAGGGFALYAWATLHFSYSDGERAGYVQKFSHKGWICKSWEGELAMVNLPGTPAQIFQFSVRDPAVAEKINSTLGQRVALHYEQHKGVPTSCFAETEYYIVAVKPVVGQ